MVQNNSTMPSRGRGRPRGYDPEVALARAGEVFWTRGYDAASLDELCAAMGINRPSLYSAFGDKQALYLKALHAYRRQTEQRTERALASGATLRDALSGFFAGAISLYTAGDRPRGCLFVGTALTPAVADPDVGAVVRTAMATLEDQLRGRIADGGDELAAGLSPRQAGALALATLHSLSVRARSGAGRDELLALAEDAVTMLCGAAKA